MTIHARRLAMWEAGLSVPEIAEREGVSQLAVRFSLYSLGVDSCARRASPRKAPTLAAPVEILDRPPGRIVAQLACLTERERALCEWGR